MSLFAVKADFQQGMWVRASSLVFPDSIEHIIEIAEELNITDIYAQVVVGGYAYYKSDILPRSQYLAKVASPDYDPLDSLIKLCHDKSIKVHAWVNALLVWSLKEKPDSTNHLFYTHPEWFIKDVQGRSMANYTLEDWKGYNLEGLYLDPAQDLVREYLANICAEIAQKYSVDGIHLDFIRYPGVLWGLPQTEKAAVFYSMDADTLRWLDLFRYPRLRLYLRWMLWHYWQINQDKERFLYQTVQLASQATKTNAMKNNCRFSAAAFAIPGSARYSYAQNWWSWEELIDYPVIMSYTQDIRLFNDYLNFANSHQKNAIMGIGFLWPGMEPEAQWEVNAVKNNSGSGICFFDYKNIDTMVDIDRLTKPNLVSESLLIDSTRYQAIVDRSTIFDYGDGRKITQIIEDSRDYVNWEQCFQFSAFLLSLSLNPYQDLQRMGLSLEDFLQSMRDDVEGFKSIDNNIFPLGDELIEPPKREVAYAFLVWSDDSAKIRKKAKRIKKLSQQKIIYPYAMDKFTRAVFAAEKGKKEICSTAKGIYVFKVKKIYNGGKKIKREKVKPELLPVYLNWTIKTRYTEVTEIGRSEH